jgi:ribonuclease M5
VEGIQDEAFLTSFMDVEIVKTNGNAIPKEEIEYVNNVDKPVVILTDSDEAGQNIRKRLNKIVKNPINIEIDISTCDKNNKHGVAESTKEEILSKLSDFVVKTTKAGNLTTSDLLNLNLTGVNSSKNRNKIIKHFQLGICNSKTFLKRLNYKLITINDLKGILNGN